MTTCAACAVGQPERCTGFVGLATAEGMKTRECAAAVARYQEDHYDTQRCACGQPKEYAISKLDGLEVIGWYCPTCDRPPATKE